MITDWSSTENEILLNPRWPAADRSFLENGARHVLAERALERHLVLSSSGTTAESWRAVKLIFIAKEAILGAARSVIEAANLRETDVIAQSLPLFHVGGLGTLARARESGARLVAVPSAGEWDPAVFARLVADHGITVASLVPTQLFDLVRLGLRSPSSLRILFLGGAVLVPGIERAARELGWPVFMTYGMTETSAMIAGRRNEGAEQGLSPFPRVEGRLSPEGRLMIKAPGLATGWARWDARANRWDWADVRVADGWFHAEDHARIEDGRWFIEGRGGDFVKIGGESVNVSALRAVWATLAGEGPVAMGTYLFAREDARRGHEIVLATESALLTAAGELRDLVASYDAKVLPFERIREMIPLEQLPRTELGKIREEELRKHAASRRSE